MRITLSAIKADVGSIGGHPRPSGEMMEAVRSAAERAVESGLLTRFEYTAVEVDPAYLDEAGVRSLEQRTSEHQRRLDRVAAIEMRQAPFGFLARASSFGHGPIL